MTTKRIFTEDQKIAIRQMRDVFGMSWDDIGVKFDADANTVRSAVDPEFDRRYRARLTLRRERRKERGYKPLIENDRTRSVAVPQSVADDRWRRFNLVHSSLTAALLNDPLPGFSALDRKQSGARA
jgi:hypothetical protein